MTPRGRMQDDRAQTKPLHRCPCNLLWFCARRPTDDERGRVVRPKRKNNVIGQGYGQDLYCLHNEVGRPRQLGGGKGQALGCARWRFWAFFAVHQSSAANGTAKSITCCSVS